MGGGGGGGREGRGSEAKANSKHWFNYDILPSTTAVFSYATGPRKLSANEQFFVGAETSKFITNKSDYIRHLFYN